MNEKENKTLLGLDAFKHAGVDKKWTDECCLNSGLVEGIKLLSQRLVEPDIGKFAGTVVSHTIDTQETSYACHGDDVAVISRQHVWQKRFDRLMHTSHTHGICCH